MSHMDARSGKYRYVGAERGRNAPFYVEMIGVDCCAREYRIRRNHSRISVVGYTLRGRGSITQNQETVVVQKGDLFIVQPDETHEYYPLVDWEFCWVNVAGDFWKQLLIRYGLGSQICYPCCALGEEFHQLVLASAQDEAPVAEIQQQVQEFLLRLTLHLHRRNAAQEADTVAVQIRTAFERCSCREHSQEEICRNLGLSVRHAQRVFKQNYGQTLHQFVLQQRLITAEALLLHTNRSVRQIAESTGFSNEKHFSTAFRKHEGLSPSQYRSQRR